MKLIHLKLFVALLISPSIAFAYVDPGAGLMLWQGLLAAFGAILVTFRAQIKYVKGIFNSIFTRKRDTSSERAVPDNVVRESNDNSNKE